MIYLSEIFWPHSLNDCKLFPNHYKFLVCLSVCQLAYFLTEIRPKQGYLLSLMRYLSEIFWRHSRDVCTLLSNSYKFLVCLSVRQLAYILTEIRPIWGYYLAAASYGNMKPLSAAAYFVMRPQITILLISIRHCHIFSHIASVL